MKHLLATIVLVILEAQALSAPSAEELYNQGQTAFDNADYATAIAKWTQSYVFSRAPGLLLNIAQAYRLSGDCAHALSSYKRFVDVDPNSDQRTLADDFINELQPVCGAPTQPPSDDRTTTKPGRTMKIAGLVMGGGGTLSLVLGLSLGYRASELGDEVTAACASASSCDWQAVKGKDAAGHRDAILGYALDAVGIVAIAGGAVMYYLGHRGAAVTVVPRPREDGAVVSWSGSW